MTASTPTPDRAARRARLATVLRDEQVDVLLVTGASNVRYLSGFTGSNGALVVPATGDAVLLTDARYEERAAHEAPGLEVVLARDFAAHATSVAADLAEGAGARLGFEADHLTYHAGRRLVDECERAGLTSEPQRGLVEELRLVKDDHELAALRRACRITADTLAAVLPTVRAGATEHEVATALDRTMVDLGADAPAFETIVASGPNAATPHHEPGGRPLQRGDLLKIDFGARVDGYHADMTRTVSLGSVTAELQAVHDLVREAQAAGVAAALAGREAHEIDNACRSRIEDAGYGDRFVHGTGHGVGLDIHEAPSVAKTSRATLAARMTLTVEPGIYLPGVGGVRIEDSVALREHGPPEILTTSPRELDAL